MQHSNLHAGQSPRVKIVEKERLSGNDATRPRGNAMPVGARSNCRQAVVCERRIGRGTREGGRGCSEAKPRRMKDATTPHTATSVECRLVRAKLRAAERRGFGATDARRG